MYRQLIPLLLCGSAVLSAPQQNSNITYVKRQTELEYSAPERKPSQRESRIEKVQLTIPGNINEEDDPIENPDNKSANIQTAQTNDSEQKSSFNYSERIYSIKTEPKNTNRHITTLQLDSILSEDIKKSEVKNSDSDSNLSAIKDSDIDPAESILNDRVTTNENTEPSSEIDATQSDEFVTEKYEEEPTVNTDAYEPTTKATSPFLPKLSYFGKAIHGSFSQNLITNAGKRRFRSHCRCEKIWNCAKLQVSVGRCPEEYFLCCS